MTDRMTERFDVPEGQAAVEADLPVYATTNLDQEGPEQGGGAGTADVAKDHATAVAQDAKDSTKGVASTAASEAKDVAHEAKSQARQLFSQLSSEANDQASGQTQRAAQGLRSLGDELKSMAENQQGESGMATDLARQGASRLHSAAGWIEQRQPGEILDEVRSFASRRPGVFLAGAAVLGLIGGRMTRGLTGDSSSSSKELSSPTSPSYATGTSPMASAPVVTEPVYGSDTTLGAGAGAGAAYGDGAAYAGGPLEEGLADDTRLGAGIDPATYTHPGSSTGVSGEPR